MLSMALAPNPSKTFSFVNTLYSLMWSYAVLQVASYSIVFGLVVLAGFRLHPRVPEYYVLLSCCSCLNLLVQIH